jgi:hypothetical protein
MSFGRTEYEFWSLTPRQIQQYFRAIDARLTRENDCRVSQAWLTARLGGMADPKTFPKLETLLSAHHPRKKQSREEMTFVVRAMHAALGGDASI